MFAFEPAYINLMADFVFSLVCPLQDISIVLMNFPSLPLPEFSVSTHTCVYILDQY